MSYLFWFILGTVIGSFLNVCIYRLPRGESVINPPSHCPNCQNRLSVLDLIPILSYFLLGGRCRYCGMPISLRYPLVEFLMGTLVLGVSLVNQSIIDIFFQTIFVFCLMVIFFVDLEFQLIPDRISVVGIFAGLLYHYFGGRNSFFSAFLGMFLGYFLLFGIGLLGKAWFRKEAMGEGDYYVGALLGAFLGWQGALFSIFLAYFLAAGVLLVLLVKGRVRIGQYVPFGPALAAGGILTLFFGKEVLAWYFQLFL